MTQHHHLTFVYPIGCDFACLVNPQCTIQSYLLNMRQIQWWALEWNFIAPGRIQIHAGRFRSVATGNCSWTFPCNPKVPVEVNVHCLVPRIRVIYRGMVPWFVPGVALLDNQQPSLIKLAFISTNMSLTYVTEFDTLLLTELPKVHSFKSGRYVQRTGLACKPWYFAMDRPYPC